LAEADNRANFSFPLSSFIAIDSGKSFLNAAAVALPASVHVVSVVPDLDGDLVAHRCIAWSIRGLENTSAPPRAASNDQPVTGLGWT
jgi:hypothetical protein